jgi:hypothetical protein
MSLLGHRPYFRDIRPCSGLLSSAERGYGRLRRIRCASLEEHGHHSHGATKVQLVDVGRISHPAHPTIAVFSEKTQPCYDGAELPTGDLWEGFVDCNQCHTKVRTIRPRCVFGHHGISRGLWVLLTHGSCRGIETSTTLVNNWSVTIVPCMGFFCE